MTSSDVGRREASQARLYPSRFSSRYYHLSSLRKHIELAAKESIPNRPNLVLVDLGCGGTPYRSVFEPYVSKYIGVDLPGNKNADFCLAPSGDSTLPDDSADIVLSTQVLEHVPSPSRYLRECYRLLGPDGLLILTTHGYWMYHPDPMDLWRWTSSGLNRILEQSGFQVIRVRGIMGLAATGLQLFQDGISSKVPNSLRPIFVFFMQTSLALVDRITPQSEKETDACVFLLVARKGTIKNDSL
jgi:SAM-dependent methyltransferase